MTFQAKPPGSSLAHFKEWRAACVMAWKYRGLIHRFGLGMDDMRSEIMVHILSKKHRYDPGKGAYSTWCWTLASRYVRRRVDYAEIAEKRSRHWRPRREMVVELDAGERQEVVQRLMAVAMTTKQRHALTMWCSGLTIRQIAARLGVTGAAVGISLKRAVQRCRKQARAMAVNADTSIDEYWGTL